MGTDVDVDLAPMPATALAQSLRPSQWPHGSDFLFLPRPFEVREGGTLPMITRYDAVRAALLDRDGWSRQVPLEDLPPTARHRTLYASWGADGVEHAMLHGSLSAINHGSTPQARQFTRELTRELLKQLLAEPPPWDLSRVIYAVSMQVILEHTLQAPPLLAQARTIRELAREHVAAPGGFFGIRRQLEAERILGGLTDHRDDLPEGGLAHHLVELHQANPGRFTRDHLIGQLWLLVVSHETQATATASTLGMLLEFGEVAYARSILGKAAPMRRLVAEAGRRAIVFPASLTITTKPFTLDGITVGLGTPCLTSYGAANLDEDKFDDPLRFNPRAERTTPHLAYGVGQHRCQGRVGAEQFIEDVLTALLQGLPEDVQLHNGCVLRETGISMAIPYLPVTPVGGGLPCGGASPTT
jgi:cytochrome P450